MGYHTFPNLEGLFSDDETKAESLDNNDFEVMEEDMI